MLAANKVKKEQHWKKKKQKGIQATKFFCEQIQQFFHKTCNEEVSRCNNNEKEM